MPSVLPLFLLTHSQERGLSLTQVSIVDLEDYCPLLQDGGEREMYYNCKMTNNAERNYCVTRQELLAIVRTLDHLHISLYGQEFHMLADHSALTLLIDFKNLEGQTTCWIQRLQEYNFTSEQHQGRKQTMPMTFSDDHAEESVPTATKSRRGQKSIRYDLQQL
jgi:hypothetical protein